MENSNTTLVKVKLVAKKLLYVTQHYSNTTLVKVKSSGGDGGRGADVNSNTTLVKVKLFYSFNHVLTSPYSNTTLVKVKSEKLEKEK